MNSEEKPMVKVRLQGPSPDEIETLWAFPVEGHLYKLDNNPFFAYGISCEDIIEAQPDEDGYLEFTRLIKKSGNRTLRIIFNESGDHPQSQSVLTTLR